MGIGTKSPVVAAMSAIAADSTFSKTMKSPSGPQRSTRSIRGWACSAKFAAGYGQAKIGNLLPSGNVLNFNPEISEYNFMAGPSYRLVALEKFGLAAFVEGGVTLGKFAGDSKGLTAAQIGVWPGNYAAAFSAGLNFDYNLFPNVALRITPTYLGSTFGGTIQNSKGLNVGVVYRFGRTR